MSKGNIITGTRKDGTKYTKNLNEGVTSIYLYSNQLSSIDLTPLTKCTEIEEIYLQDNQLSSIDLTPLAKCTELIKLNLGDNLLEDLIVWPT